jgi:hypothetical protein
VQETCDLLTTTLPSVDKLLFLVDKVPATPKSKQEIVRHLLDYEKMTAAIVALRSTMGNRHYANVTICPPADMLDAIVINDPDDQGKSALSSIYAN